jgi:histone H2B
MSTATATAPLAAPKPKAPAKGKAALAKKPAGAIAKKAPAIKAKAADGETATTSAPRKTKKNYHSLATYIYKLIKTLRPDMGISNKGMAVLEAFVHDIFNRLATEAARLARFNKRSTIGSKEIQTAVRLVLPGDLSSHAAVFGITAVKKYEEYRAQHDKLPAKKPKVTKPEDGAEASAPTQQAESMEQ